MTNSTEKESIGNSLIILNIILTLCLPIIPSSRSSALGVDVLTLVTGTNIAQIITILATPIITRLYGPETFGLLTLYMSITSIIGIIACILYELAIIASGIG